MGKNRRSSGGSGNPQEEGTYISGYTGEYVPRGDLTEEEMDDFNDKMDSWLHYYTEQPDGDVTMKQLKYIFSHFQSTDNNDDVPNGHLYRFENAYHFEDGKYKVGDKLKHNGSLRSFSKDVDSTNRLLDDEFNGYEEITIYRTVGNAPYFDVGKHSNPFPEQQECFVPLDAMRIKNISKFSGSNMRDEIYDKYGIDLGNYQYSLNHVNVVDVSYDPSVQNVTSIQGQTVSTKNIKI